MEQESPCNITKKMSTPVNTEANGNGLHGGMSFVKLDGHANYNTWKFSIRMLLIFEGVWKCVLGEDNDVSKDQRALARICLAIQPHLYQYVRDAKTSKEAWQSLCNVFEDNGLSRRVLLLKKLHRTEYSSCSSMGEYIETIMSLVQQLADINKVIADEEIAEILLSGLPMEYDALVSNLETALMTSNALTSELVRSRLLQEEIRKNGRENTAYILKKNTQVKKRICHYCQRPGGRFC